MMIMKSFIIGLSLLTMLLITETAIAIGRGAAYPYEQMRAWENYPARIDKPCNPYNKSGCPDFIIEPSPSPVKVEAASQSGSIIRIDYR